MNAESVPTPEASGAFVYPQLQGFRLPASITNSSWGVGMAGVLVDFTPGEVKLVLEGLVSMGTLVEVHVGGCLFSGEVLFCERREEGFETHVSINDFDESGLRRTPRFPVSLPATVFASDLDSPAPATIVDISGDGLGIEVPAHLTVNTTIAVESESNVALGIVRYSREISPLRFRIGVQLHHIVNKEPAPAVHKTRIGLIGKVSSRFTFGSRSN